MTTFNIVISNVMYYYRLDALRMPSGRSIEQQEERYIRFSLIR